MTTDDEKKQLAKVAELFAQPGAADKLATLMATPPAQATPLEAAVKQAAEVESLKAKLDSALREVAELKAKLVAADNRVRNAEASPALAGVNIITELVQTIIEAPHKTSRMIEAVERANQALLRAGAQS